MYKYFCVTTYEGRIELAGLSAPGVVSLNANDNILSLNFPNNVQFADIYLKNQAFVSVYGAAGGDIVINARNFEMSNSRLFAGVSIGVENNNVQAGDIKLNTTGAIFISNSRIENSTYGRGNAGNIFIQTPDLVSISGSDIVSNIIGKETGEFNSTNNSLLRLSFGSIGTFARKAANNISILLNDINNTDKLKPVSREPKLFSSTVSNIDDLILNDNLNSVNISSLKPRLAGEGKGGNIYINARTLSMNDAATLFTSTLGRGNAGSITVNIADNLNIKNGSQLNTSTYGQGNAGDVKITARNAIFIDGIGVNGNPSAIATQVGAFQGLVGNGKAGNIELNTRSLFINNGALVSSSTFGRGNAGNIAIDVSDTININGIINSELATGIFSTVETGAIGKGGDIRVTTSSLSLANNGLLSAETQSQGDGGNIFIQTDNSVSLSNESIIGTSVLAGGIGIGGDIDIITRTLSLASGSQVATGLYRQSEKLVGGIGKAGNIRINTSDSVTLSGVGSLGFPSGLITLTERGASGEAGNITVTTPNFRVISSAQAIASTFNDSKGGDITINANIFEAINGGQVITNTRGGGNAGNITLNVADNVTIIGSDPNFSKLVNQVTERLKKPGQTDQPTDVISDQGAVSGIFANTTAGSTGKGGNIFIDPPNITISDGAQVSVNSGGSGDAGDITIEAGKLTLNNKASIFAQTASSQGGNIKLTAQDYLLLRNGSQISTTAGTALAGGDGGDITINTPFIIAIPNQNNDITANAYSGRGGNVNINSRGIFGIEARTQASDKTNDITASSDLGVSGTVNVSSPDNSSLQNSLIEFPQSFIDTNALIANSCIARASQRQEGSLVITGSGALPNRPGDTSASNYATDKVRSVNSENTSRPWKKGDPIFEAQGVYRLPDGRLIMSRECF